MHFFDVIFSEHNAEKSHLFYITLKFIEVTRITASTDLETTLLPEDEMDDQSNNDQLFSDIQVNPKIDTSDVPEQNPRKFLRKNKTENTFSPTLHCGAKYHFFCLLCYF